MEWMLNNQDARRNLTPAERLVAAEKLREKIAEEAKEKQKKDSKKFYGNQHKSVDSTPCGEQSKNINKAKVHTDKEIAKIAGVGTGTVARFNTIMKSNDEELKNKVITGEKKIGTA
jgi:hypothetical protein